MKSRNSIILIILYLFFVSCITEYDAGYIESTAGILVVEGMILEPEGTFVKLSRTKSINSNLPYESVTTAKVNVLCDDGTIYPLENEIVNGMYILKEPLSFNPSANYAIEIHLDGKIYQSDYIEAIRTPEIDEVSWVTENDGQQVNIRVSTHDSGNAVQYYRWVYKEDWEIVANYYSMYRYDPSIPGVVEQNLLSSNNRYYCWGQDSSKSFILGSSEKQAESVIKNHKILELKAGDSRFSYLYSIEVRQYALNKDAYNYFQNLQKNIEETGSLFAPLPTEMEGNIRCISDPEESVIGFIPVTTERKARIYIKKEEVPEMQLYYHCGEVQEFPYTQSTEAYHAGLGILSDNSPKGYNWVPIRCVDCLTLYKATKNKPYWWPNDHL